jgi:DHA2 family multidrug resistance protein
MASKMRRQVGDAQASSAATKSLYGRVQAQVFMMSFIQLIWVIAGIFALSAIPLVMLRFKKKVTGPIAAH